MDESETVLNAHAVVVFIFHAQVIGAEEITFEKGIFRLDHTFRVFPEFLRGILHLDFGFALALQFDGERDIVEMGGTADAEAGNFGFGTRRKSRVGCIARIVITCRQCKCAEISFSARRVIGLAFPDFVAGNTRAQWAIVVNQIQIVFGLVVVVALAMKATSAPKPPSTGVL